MKAKEHQFLKKEGYQTRILTNSSSLKMSLLSEQIKRNNRTRSSLVLKKRLNPQKLRTNKSRKLRLQKIHISIRKMIQVTKIAFKQIKHSTQLKTSYQLPSQRHNSVTKFIEYPSDLARLSKICNEFISISEIMVMRSLFFQMHMLKIF